MYNLIVVNNNDRWDGSPFLLERSRFLEYTDNEIKAKFQSLEPSMIEEILKLPTIFAHERQEKRNPYFGSITKITTRRTRREEIRIRYEILKLDNFITYEQIDEFHIELDVNKWEMKRAHWAIKDVDLPKELERKNINLPNWITPQKNVVDINTHEFKVAFSFPGEVRNFVEPITKELEKILGLDSYFYDDNYTAQLALPSLDTLLQDIYRLRSKLIVVFLCEKYQEKKWCKIEFKAVKEIIFNKQNNRIMYIRMDEGQVDGVFKIDGYIDGRKHTPKEIAEFISTRVHALENK